MEFGSSSTRGKFHVSSSSNLNTTLTTTTIHHINFGGKTIETTVTSNEAAITQWLTDITTSYLHKGKEVIFGLDIEWKPNRSKYMNNKAATLQLCIDTKCLIIQLIHINSIPQSLRDFLSLSDITFVGVEVGNDVAKLNRDYGLRCSKVRDLREAAISGGFGGGFTVPGPPPGLKKLALQIEGLMMSKPKYVSLSNWEARVLSDAQVEYASIDAYASYRVGHKLLVQAGSTI